MPLSDFSAAKQAEIAVAVAQPMPPAKWLDLGRAQIRSRAWYEWYWQRGIDPDGRRDSLPSGLRQFVIERDGMVCGLCGDAIEKASDIHIDHIVPVSRGGPDSLDNLQVAHSWCNIRKGARI